jgi:hypothetical protein
LARLQHLDRIFEEMSNLMALQSKTKNACISDLKSEIIKKKLVLIFQRCLTRSKKKCASPLSTE